DAASDALIANLLAALKPGLTPLEFWRWLYNDFMQALTDLPALSEASLVRYLEFATMKLKEAGYTDVSSRKLESIWKRLAKLKAARQKSERDLELSNQQISGPLPARFIVVQGTSRGAEDPCLYTFLGVRRDDAPPLRDFTTAAIYDTATGQCLTNVNLVIDEEIRFVDEYENRTIFKGRLLIYGKEKPFEIDARDFANNGKLLAAIQETAG